MAKVSEDHAPESLCMQASKVLSSSSACRLQGKPPPRPITPEEIQQHNGQDEIDNDTTTTKTTITNTTGFWAVIDGWVVDATDFLKTHPGGLKKLLSTDSAKVGATGDPFGFSLSRGKNAHFPETGRRFQAGVTQYLQGSVDTDSNNNTSNSSSSEFLPPGKVDMSPEGTLLILGMLSHQGEG
jgi:hypothetical protein